MPVSIEVFTLSLKGPASLLFCSDGFTPPCLSTSLNVEAATNTNGRRILLRNAGNSLVKKGFSDE
jgi:hypothetical protein